ncbi:hypothetical protein QE109_13650 [Fusibacter bizertensis]|uniref:Uncharacterized protein n=1 Tax=Fusibacter bizertensis TaxID=1488331 RepID=A0ABT6NFM0_9FIRM|nr:hypothetical protein [Fusibacter bizertensis]MDH8679196.1 hypothetical protein [Fusibacter bizertensis]
MKVFIFINTEENNFTDYIDMVSEYILFTNKAELDHHYNACEYPILILLSQPSIQVETMMNSFNWHFILSHKGIRNNSDCLSIGAYFETIDEFSIVFELATKKQWLAIKQEYIKTLGKLSDEDLVYLHRMTGEAIDLSKGFKNIKKVLNPQKNQRIEMSGTLTVVNSPETALMLADELSILSKGSVIMVDGNLLMPCLDEKIGIKKIQTNIKSHITGIDNTGLNIALDTIAKGLNLSEYIESIVVKKNKNLDLLLGNYNLFNYEHYDDQALKKLLFKLTDLYQFIIISVPLFPYDAMTMLSIHISDINIFGIEKSITDTRYLYQYLNLLSTKQGIPISKNLVVSKVANKRSGNIGDLVLKEVFKDYYVGNLAQKKKQLVKKVVERIR